MALGVPHPDYLLEMLTAKQLREWEIVYSIEPFGEEPKYVRSGIIASTLINLKLKKETKKTTPFDFMPALYTGKKSGGKQSMEEMKALMSSMANNKE